MLIRTETLKNKNWFKEVNYFKKYTVQTNWNPKQNYHTEEWSYYKE